MVRCGRVDVFMLLLVVWLLVGPMVAQVRHPLPVLWMMPVSSGVWGDLTAGVSPAVRLALQDLKKQPPPLGHYEIQLQLLDSQCEASSGLKALFDAIWAGPKYLLVFGGVCPSVTALIARSLPALNLVQVSFAASSPWLSNRKRYGNLFSTGPSDRALNQAAVKLLQRYRWTRVGVITQEGPGRSEMKTDLIKQLLKADVQVVSTESFYDDACSSLKKLKERDVRIVIGQFENDSASEVFCCAYRLNLFGARYQWIVAGGGAAGWRLGREVSGCTANSLLTAADGSIRLQIRQLSNTNTPGISGRTPQDYQDAYLREMTRARSKVSPLHAFAYDAVWVAAKAGPVFFRDGERMTLINLIQFQGSGPAKDQTEVRLQQRRVSLLLYSVMSSVAMVTIIITLTVLCLMIFNRRRRLLSAGSGSQDELLLLGMLLSSASILVSGLDEASLPDRTLELLCSVHLWTLSVGHTVGFSVLLVKTWRVYSLCSIEQKVTQRPRQRASCIVLWMFLLDVFVLTSWQTLDPQRWVVTQHRLESDPADEDVTIRPYSEHCSSTNMELWLTAVYGYKGPLLGLGCFLAWSIRTAAHSERLTLSIFVVTAFSVSGVSGSLLTSHNPPVQFCVSSALILGCNTFILSRLFATKLLNLWSDGSELQSEAAEEEEEEEEQVRRLNQQLKTQMNQLDVEIETITVQLSEMLHHMTREKNNAGEATSVTHAAQVSAEDRKSERKPLNPDVVNSPEHVRRRLSVQLPILHHSYLPVVGGVSASSSSLFIHHDDNFLYT
ncbi:hypothetical protein PAMP_002529 [Pampus punctatissimus]